MSPPANKSARRSSRRRNKIDPDFEYVYQRKTCQKCGKPISQKRILNCKKRRFWPVCSECEPIVIKKYQEGIEKLAEIRKRFG